MIVNGDRNRRIIFFYKPPVTNKVMGRFVPDV